MAKQLSVKQELFIEAYLGKAKGNATEACRLAGYAGNENTLKQMASENLAKPYIKAAITKRLAVNKKIMSADEVLEGLTAIAKQEEEAAGNRIRAMELLGKHHQLFTDQIKHSGEVEITTPVLNVILSSGKTN